MSPVMNKALYTNMTGMRLLGSIKFQKCHVLLAQCFIVYKGLAHTFSNLILRETMGGELGIYHYPILQMRVEAGGCAVRASPGRLGSLAQPQRRGTSP